MFWFLNIWCSGVKLLQYLYAIVFNTLIIIITDKRRKCILFVVMQSQFIDTESVLRKNVVLLFPLICENSKTCLEKIMINPSKKDVYLIIMITGKSYSNPSVCLIDNNIWPSSFSIENRWCRYSNNAKMLWFYHPFIHKTM